MPSPARKCVSRPDATGKPSSANPAAISTPRVLSAENFVLSQTVPGAWPFVSWLPLDSTGFTPVTVNEGAAVAEVAGSELAAAEPPGADVTGVTGAELAGTGLADSVVTLPVGAGLGGMQAS